VNGDEQLQAIISTGMLGMEGAHRELLQSIVDVARGIFRARAASIMLHDPERQVLVFAAVSGEGEGSLEGQTIPESTGIAGWVLASQETMVVEDVTQSPIFSRETAERTGYVPNGIMAAPLLREEEVLGVLNVLDRQAQAAEFRAEEMQLLNRFAQQAAVAAALVRVGRQAQQALDHVPAEAAAVARLARSLAAADASRRDAATRLIGALEDLLAG
jgi:GAF domain-containing protein